MKNYRKTLFIAFFFISLILTAACCKKTKTYTIGIVNVNPGLESVIEGFKSGLNESLRKEGRQVNYIYNGTLNMDQADAVLKTLVEKKVDLILAVSTPAAVKAKSAVQGTKIPVVFAPVFSPVEAGLVKTLIQPGGNITGIQSGGSTAKALEWHKKIVPGAKRLFVPCKCGDSGLIQSLADLREAAQKLKVELLVSEVDSAEELQAALDNIPRDADSIWLANSYFLVSHINLIVNAALKRKLPLSSSTSQYRAGVMVSYAQDSLMTGRQASRLAYKILEGAHPSSLPVEMPEFFLGINLRTARAVGVSISDDILMQADGIVR